MHAEPLPTRREERTLSTSIAIMSRKAIDRLTRIVGSMTELRMRRTLIVWTRILSEDGIPGLAIEVGMLSL